VIALVLREGRPSRIGDYSPAAGGIAERAREIGIRSVVGCPIVVGGRTWGVMAVARYEAEPFAPETETRIARFSELVATAIANAEARGEVERLAAEQAALRRVATLVAEGASPTAVFDAVAAEMEGVLDAEPLRARRRGHRRCPSGIGPAQSAARHAGQPPRRERHLIGAPDRAVRPNGASRGDAPHHC
jgi:GAF domain-containing protein